MTVASYTNTDGSCFPGVSRLAVDCGMDRRTIQRHLKKLEQAGLLTRERRRNAEGDTSNLYRLAMPPEPEGERQIAAGGAAQRRRGGVRLPQGGAAHSRPNLLVEPVSEGEAPRNATALVAAIRALVQKQGISRYIPRPAVEALGPDVSQAYDALGGAERFLETLPSKLHFLEKDFAQQLAIARRSAA